MGWFGLALLATMLESLLVFGDKYLIEREMRNPFALLFLFIWINMFFSLILWAVTGFQTVAGKDAILLMLAGAAPAYAGLFYFQAISRAETSRVILLLQMSPLFTLILAVIFRNEQLILWQMLGFSLILTSAIGVSLQKTGQMKHDEGPDLMVLLLMVAASVILAAGVVLADDLIERLVVDWHSLTVAIVYGGIGQFLGGMVLYILAPGMRHAFHRHLRLLRWQGLFAFVSVEVGFIGHRFIIYMALGSGPVSLVMVVGSLNVFFGILLGWVLTIWKPLIFKEDIRKQTLLHKGGWALLAFAGILLIR